MEIPNELSCPITQDLMNDPVVAADGHSYERKAIEDWFKTKDTSPLTNKPISNQLIPNYALRDAIEKFRTEHPNPKHEISLQLKVGAVHKNANSLLLNTMVIPPLDGDRQPAILLLLIDVSGSMGTLASKPSTTGEVDGFSRLDLVKHSVRTIINVLNENDSLCIISFSNNATTVLPVSKMTAQGKFLANEKLSQLQPDASTNIWDALREAFSIAQTIQNQNVSILLLTDGIANCNPPRGVLPTLHSHMGSHKVDAVIHTFGFGYDLDSKLLVDIAELGSGVFGFIPDCTMVGTVFVNVISNILAVAVRKVVLRIEHCGQENAIDFGPVCFGQNRTFSYLLNLKGNIEFTVSLCLPGGKKIVQKFTSVECDDVKELYVSQSKYFTLNAIRGALNEGDLNKKKRMITTAIEKIEKLPSIDDSRVSALLKDLKGQVSEALSRDDWYEKWGIPYLMSLSRAHELQICHNFKDPGVQVYGGKLFREIQSIADEIFCNLPAPTPSIVDNYGPTTTASAPVSMSSYYNPSGPCFDGNGLVITTTGVKKVSELSKNDVLENGAKVVCVVLTNLKDPVQVAEINKVLLSPWHPVNISGKWQFPKNVSKATEKNVGRFYNLVLDKQHMLKINGLDCVTMGHHFTDDIVKHEYFGSDLVLSDLKKMKGWADGLVRVSALVQRDENSLTCHLVEEK